MKIKNLFSGVVTNERADIARALIRQGMAEAVEPDNGDSLLPKPGQFKLAPPRFWVDKFKTLSGDEYLSIFMQVGSVIRRYSGSPTAVHNRRDHTGREFCSALGFPVPQAIRDEYASAWKRNERLREPGFAAEGIAAQQSIVGTGFTPADTNPSNAAQAATKEYYDKSVKAGKVPFSGHDAKQRVIG
jgi:hypothetical protein